MRLFPATRRFGTRPASLTAGLAAPVLGLLALALVAAALPRAAAAEGAVGGAGEGASGWAAYQFSQVRLVAATSGVGTGDTVRLGLHFKMKPGWKIYWRSPGDAGFRPRINWDGSQNLRNATMHWPAPVRFRVLGFNTAGYKHEVVLPVTVRLAEPGKALMLRAAVDYLVCDEICIPRTAKLSLDLPAGAGQNTRFAYEINRFNARVPRDETVTGIRLGKVTASDTPKPMLAVTARSEAPFAQPDLFVEGPPGLEFGAPKVHLSDGGRVANLTVGVRKVGKDAPQLEGALLTLTLVDRDRALEKTAVTESGAVTLPGSAGNARSLAGILLLALLGGLILNLRPCVLPVLSLKVLSVAAMGGAERAHVRGKFVATAAGILASFLVLAGAMIGLKAAGTAVGWGIQFQQPWFLIALAVIVTLFAANLWGLYEIRLPGAVADAAVKAGGGSTGKHSLAGSFVTGAFVAVLATPCSAPFLGTAIGFALSRGTGEILAVFTALGIGLAAPYLLVAAVPGVATRLPKPGRWMVWLRAVLGVALALTAVWLLSVLAAQVSERAAWGAGALLGGVVVLLWMRRLGRGALRPIATVLAAIAALATFAVPSLLPGARTAPTVNALAKGIWRPFDRAAIVQLVAQGKTVFVDVTADWCITCQANKRLVLNREPVASLLRARNVVPMVADWTRPDPGITRFLTEHGRYGIPFNIVYGPQAPGGVALPELLSESAVVEAFTRARGTATAGKPGAAGKQGAARD